MDFVTADSFDSRLRAAVSAAWAVFGRKVGGGLVPVNKEASMQLQYAYILKQLLPMAIQQPGESAEVELETGVRVEGARNNIDILVKGASPGRETRIAIELKCYRDKTSEGTKRGAADVFMKDVYEDLHVLERYLEAEIAEHGIALVMVDIPFFVAPKRKNGKCWAYDISHGFNYPGGVITVDTGGKPVRVELLKQYEFRWKKYGGFWFLEVEGAPSRQLHHLATQASSASDTLGRALE